MSETLNFPRDVERRKYFVQESVEHPAKLEIRTYRWLVEKYTKPGHIILDPMSGIGTVHLAALMDRHTTGIEISDRFVEIQQQNIEKLKGLGATGTMSLVQMDCRRFLPLAKGSIDAIIFSPPYGAVQKASGTTSQFLEDKRIKVGYDEQIANIGNITVYPLYLSAMKQVYKLCADSLSHGQIFILVTKDFLKSGERIWLSRDTIRICMEVGFSLLDWHLRYTDPRLFQITAKAGREAKGKDKPYLNISYEDLLVFQKE